MLTAFLKEPKQVISKEDYTQIKTKQQQANQIMSGLSQTQRFALGVKLGAKGMVGIANNLLSKTSL